MRTSGALGFGAPARAMQTPAVPQWSVSRNASSIAEGESAAIDGASVTLAFDRGLRQVEPPTNDVHYPIPNPPQDFFTLFTGANPPSWGGAPGVPRSVAWPAPGQPNGKDAIGFALEGNVVTLAFPDPVVPDETAWVAYQTTNKYAPLDDGSGSR